MRHATLALLTGLAATPLWLGAQDAAKPAHVQVAPAEVKWGPAPPALPKGAQSAVIHGDPTKPGPYVMRVKFPAGYKVAPHWHPTDENVTVLEGTISFGMGDTFDAAAAKDVPTGGFSMMPAQMRHYAFTKGGATLQLHGVGPFGVTYVNPADDPRTAAAPAPAK
jgi:quercetin dioxygenase-like cupin family protein